MTMNNIIMYIMYFVHTVCNYVAMYCSMYVHFNTSMYVRIYVCI